MQPIEAPGSCPNPPRWARLERELIDMMNGTYELVLNRYTDETGKFRWPPTDQHVGSDGFDDTFESFWNWPLFYAIGGDPGFLEASHRQFDVIVEQFSSVQTPHGHPMAVEEYEQCRDWFHHGEGNLLFYNLCLADPDDERVRNRAARFAGFYLSESPVGNYDGERKVVRGPMNGSMGPTYCDFTAFPHHPYGAAYNWSRRGLPFQDIDGIDSIDDITDPANEERLLAVLNERCSRGDVPMNLAITALMTNAYLLHGDERYRTWVREYTTAWLERTRDNDGIVPDNVGRSGEIGEYIDGKWYGGFYGWTWSGWHVIGAPLTIAAENVALLEGGEFEATELVRSTVDTLLAHSIDRDVTPGDDTTKYVPHRYGEPGDYLVYDVSYSSAPMLRDEAGQLRFEDGWFQFQPLSNPNYLLHLWFTTMADDDAKRLQSVRDHRRRDWEYLEPQCFGKSAGGGHAQAWFAYLRGEFPDYPRRILELDRYHVTFRREAIEREEPQPSYDSAHYLQYRNPIAEEALVQLTMGGPRPVYNGGLLQTRVRHYDADQQRPGLPADVAALVERITPKQTVLTMLNLGSEKRRSIVQAGAYGEHTFRTVRWGRDLTADGGVRTVDDDHMQISLPPRSQISLVADIDRYDNEPSYDAPGAITQ